MKGPRDFFTVFTTTLRIYDYFKTKHNSNLVQTKLLKTQRTLTIRKRLIHLTILKQLIFKRHLREKKCHRWKRMFVKQTINKGLVLSTFKKLL